MYIIGGDMSPGELLETMIGLGLLAAYHGQRFIPAAAAANVDSETLDFLIEG